jgi:glyoxylase-like metal-dependent hydrolase (beta-lactamase superfamily II)
MTPAGLLVTLGLYFAAAAQPAPTPTAAHHDRAPSDVFKRQALASNVHALYGRGGNVGFFVGPDAILVVDSQYKDIAPGIVAEIQKVSDKPIKYLLNTHHHGDHVGGNEVFQRFAVIIAHDNVRKRMLMAPQQILERSPKYLEEARKAGNAAMVKRLEEEIEWARKVKLEEIPAPVLTYDSELRVHLGGETIQVWHTPPAHTDGDSVVFFEKANVIHMGDNFFHKLVPFIDASSGGSAQGYVTMIDRVLARVPANATVIPGHGQVTDVAGLKAFRQEVADLIDAARKARAAGKTRQQFVDEVDFPQMKDYPGYPARFKANAGVAYDEVK